VGDKRFGPNTDQVDAFLERLRQLTPSDWEAVVEAAPGVGAVPDLEVSLSPDYFKALEAATRVAKSEVFSGSESAFFDAMRTAQLVADGSDFQPSTRPELANATLVEERLSPDEEDEALTRVMSTAYEEESWRRVMNACMVAAGALVIKEWIRPDQAATLIGPFQQLS
jgi:hypothetical protein